MIEELHHYVRLAIYRYQVDGQWRIIRRCTPDDVHRRSCTFNHERRWCTQAGHTVSARLLRLTANCSPRLSSFLMSNHSSRRKRQREGWSVKPRNEEWTGEEKWMTNPFICRTVQTWWLKECPLPYTHKVLNEGDVFREVMHSVRRLHTSWSSNLKSTLSFRRASDDYNDVTNSCTVTMILLIHIRYASGARLDAPRTRSRCGQILLFAFWFIALSFRRERVSTMHGIPNLDRGLLATVFVHVEQWRPKCDLRRGIGQLSFCIEKHQ